MSSEQRSAHNPNQPHAESLSWNPLLNIMETVHALNRLSEESAKSNKATQEENRMHQKQVADKAMEKLFRVRGEEKRLFFSIKPLDQEESPSPSLEFIGFYDKDGQWFLAFSGDEPVFVPVSQLQHTEQINGFRDETVINN